MAVIFEVWPASGRKEVGDVPDQLIELDYDQVIPLLAEVDCDLSQCSGQY